MKTIPVGTKGHEARVSDEDYERLKGIRWYLNQGGGRVVYAHNSKVGSMHRLVLGITDGTILVDHKDLDGLNNQRENLRSATVSQNAGNRKKPVTSWRGGPTSKYKGVSAFLGKGGIRYKAMCATGHIGTYELEEDAARAYDSAIKELYGEFARGNFI